MGLNMFSKFSYAEINSTYNNDDNLKIPIGGDLVK
jgi:hypothetical protein